MDRPLSGTVWASWVSYERTDGRKTNLLVLWRGSPRWFIGPGANRHNNRAGSTGFFDFTRGGVSLRLDFDFDSRTVTVRDERAPITEASVVFVDAVDSPGGPVILDSRRVGVVGQVVADDPIAEVIRRSPDLFEYLQCDDTTLGGTMRIMCDQVRPALR